MEISAMVGSTMTEFNARVSTAKSGQEVIMQAKANGKGVNGGELLMLALATCYCNDLYGEAERFNIETDSVEVEARAEFPGVGLAACNIRYQVRVSSAASASALADLIRRTDVVAEVHNTIRTGVPVTLAQ